MEMRDENTLPAMFPVMSMRVDSPRGPTIPLRPNQSPISVAPASAGVGHLLMRAITLFESNREVAWRCLTDASALSGDNPEQLVLARHLRKAFCDSVASRLGKPTALSST
jgi:hypothetical protein